jgi:hypothetical protein
MIGTIIAVAIIVIALAVIVLRVYRTVTGKRSVSDCGCGSCDACNSTTQLSDSMEKHVNIQDRSQGESHDRDTTI